MNVSRSILLLSALLLIAAAPGALPPEGEPFVIDWFTIDAGGGHVAGGNLQTVLEIESTIGQPDVGPAMTSGPFRLVGGYWARDACPADINGDGAVDVNDLLLVLAAWGPCPGCPADIDGNGEVDVNDLLAVLAAWGPCP